MTRSIFIQILAARLATLSATSTTFRGQETDFRQRHGKSCAAYKTRPTLMARLRKARLGAGLRFGLRSRRLAKSGGNNLDLASQAESGPNEDHGPNFELVFALRSATLFFENSITRESRDKIIRILEKHGFPLGATVEHDKDVR